MVAGNWKMNLDRQAAIELATGVARRAGEVPAVDLALCPPFVYLQTVADALGDAPVLLGAQDVYHEAEGAFTGEISVAMLRDIRCQLTILGHSERRHVLGETNQDVHAKLRAALEGGLLPVVCVGETLAEREDGRTAAVIQDQFEGAMVGLNDDQMAGLVIAYEPVWAIGTGKVATPEQAEEVHADLRRLVHDSYNAEVADQVRILYGGSVKPGNAADLLGQDNVDGALVGGASLDLDDFLAIAIAGSSDSV